MSDIKSKTEVYISTRTVIRILLIFFVAILFYHFIGHITHVLTLIFIAFFLALALNPAVSWIAARLKSKSRARATGIAYVVVVTGLLAFFSIVLPPLFRQTATFISEVPQTIAEFQTQDTSVARFVRRYKIDQQLNDLSSDFSNHIPTLRNELLNTLGRVGSAIISTLTVFVLTFMMLVSGPSLLKKIWELDASAQRNRHAVLAKKMYNVVTGYVNGQLVVAVIAASFALIALLIASTLLHVSVNAVALAGIVALGGLIPMVGNPISSAIVILACLFVSLPLAIIMLIYFIVYYQLESITILPYVQSKHNQLSPLIVFIAALVGIGFGGLLGALIAIPAAGCIKVLIEDYVEHRNKNTIKAA